MPVSPGLGMQVARERASFGTEAKNILLPDMAFVLSWRETLALIGRSRLYWTRPDTSARLHALRWLLPRV